MVKVLAASEARSHAHLNTFIQKLPEDVSTNNSKLEAQVRAKCDDTTNGRTYVLVADDFDSQINV